MTHFADLTFEQKELVFRHFWYAFIRSLTLSVLIVACLHSSFSFEIKAMIIAGAILAYVMFALLATLLVSMLAAQLSIVAFTQLTFISLETKRITPENQEPSNLIAERVNSETPPPWVGGWTESPATFAALGSSLSFLIVLGGWFVWPFFREVLLQWAKLL